MPNPGAMMATQLQCWWTKEHQRDHQHQEEREGTGLLDQGAGDLQGDTLLIIALIVGIVNLIAKRGLISIKPHHFSSDENWGC